MFLDASHVDDSGAMLFNVAVIRAKDHLIAFANLAYLDQKLPGYVKLRDILSEMQELWHLIVACNPMLRKEYQWWRQIILALKRPVQ